MAKHDLRPYTRERSFPYAEEGASVGSHHIFAIERSLPYAEEGSNLADMRDEREIHSYIAMNISLVRA